jgi:hypothetical protein
MAPIRLVGLSAMLGAPPGCAPNGATWPDRDRRCSARRDGRRSDLARFPDSPPRARPPPTSRVRWNHADRVWPVFPTRATSATATDRASVRSGG